MTLSERKDQRIDFRTLDVTDTDSISAFINYAIDSFKKIDELVNSAGYALCKEIESQNESNYLGVISMIKAVVPSMMKQESGHIINIASIAGIMGVYGYTGSPERLNQTTHGVGF